MTPVEWIMIIVAVMMVASMASMFMMQPPPPPEAGITPIQSPNTTTGQIIPVLFGSRLISGSSVIWWGDVAVVMVKANAGGKKG